MGKAIVDVLIPVSEEAASWLQDAEARRKAGAVLTALARGNAADTAKPDALKDVMDEIGRRAAEQGLTETEIEEELAAYNAERRA